jgi:hypothetical protein
MKKTSVTLSELRDKIAKGELTESEAGELAELKISGKALKKTGLKLSLHLEELIRSVDPYKRKDTLAALLIAGKRRKIPHFDSPEFRNELAALILQQVESGETSICESIASLTESQVNDNCYNMTLAALLQFEETEGRWPTVEELEISVKECYPEIFESLDPHDRQWRRVRESLGLDWLSHSKAGRKIGDKNKHGAS